MSLIKLYNDYNKAKELFTKPIFHYKFGLWKNDPLLPVWKREPIINLGGSVYKMDAKCYVIKDTVSIVTGYNTWKDSTGKEHQSKNYNEVPKHNLPGNLKSGDIVWRRDIRKKLKRLGLGWVKPQYQLPTWLAFDIFNFDVTWKSKWGDTRFEFPPQFTIVFFGLSLSFWLTSPKVDVCWDEDHYWEGVIDYGFYKNKTGFDISEFLKQQGYMYWTEYSEEERLKRNEIYNKYKDENGCFPKYDSKEHKKMRNELDKYPGVNMARMCVRENHIRTEMKHHWEAAFSELKAKHLEYNWIR